MSDAPETIWAEIKTCTVDGSGASRLLAMDREFSRGTEYRRADLPPTPEQIAADARVRKLVAAGNNCRAFTALFARGDESMHLALREWESALAEFTTTTQSRKETQ